MLVPPLLCRLILLTLLRPGPTGQYPTSGVPPAPPSARLRGQAAGPALWPQLPAERLTEQVASVRVEQRASGLWTSQPQPVTLPSGHLHQL